MPQSITDVLSYVRGGYALHDAAKKLEEVMKAVKATGQVGELTITIKVSPDKTDDRILKLLPKIKAKVPEKGYAEGFVFLGPDGRISKEDPAQLDMLEERRAAGVSNMSEAALNQVGRGS